MIEQALKALILEKYKSVKEFANIADMPYSTLDSILKRGVEKANISNIIRLCKALQIDTDALANGQIVYKADLIKAEISKREQAHIEKYRALDEYGKGTVDLLLDREYGRCIGTQEEAGATGVLIELNFSEQSASAGTGTYLGPESFRSISVQENALTSRALFCLPVSGDSMEPLYYDRDILLIADEPVRIGEIGIFTINGSGYVKKRGETSLLSLNPLYEPIPMNDSIRCNGKVVGILKPDWIAE
ncbi:MAG: hypothetical protein HFG20_05655 [Anaerotruncus sp.]|jgi:phage repressor protein C with HTH and peptisase S24 domain|nr:hypothetical protein [Anaerotruncus sp.]